MTHQFAELAFTPAVQAFQEQMGSRRAYAKAEGSPVQHERDSFYMATVSETGWPYIQHRGGPAGFVRVLDEKTLGFSDYRGNRQYVSLGNLSRNNRVALFFMDYPDQARLKLLGRARPVGLDEEPELAAKLAMPDCKAKVERCFLNLDRGLRLELHAAYHAALHCSRSLRRYRAFAATNRRA